jgi:hypothetical protein
MKKTLPDSFPGLRGCLKCENISHCQTALTNAFTALVRFKKGVHGPQDDKLVQPKLKY